MSRGLLGKGPVALKARPTKGQLFASASGCFYPQLPEPGGTREAGSAAGQLRDLHQVTLPLCAPVSSFINWNDEITPKGFREHQVMYIEQWCLAHSKYHRHDLHHHYY